MDSRSQEWIDQTSLNIKELFEMFDKDKTGAIVQDEVGTIVRAIGIYPTEKALSDIISQVTIDEYSGLVSYSKLEKKILQLLAEKHFRPDPRDVILQAFRTLDPENTGYVSCDLVEEKLKTCGTPFKQHEIDAFLAVARDNESGLIYYEDYASLFPKDVL